MTLRIILSKKLANLRVFDRVEVGDDIHQLVIKPLDDLDSFVLRESHLKGPTASFFQGFLWWKSGSLVRFSSPEKNQRKSWTNKKKRFKLPE